MTRSRSLALVLACLLASGPQGTVPPALAALPATQPKAPEPYWREIAGGPGTMCGTGERFSFWVHAENPARFLILLNGGGACWDPATCGNKPTTDFTSDLSDFPASTGILAMRRADNPLRGFSVVLVPYCTGDVGLGTRDVSYGGSDSTGSAGISYVVHHQGRNNTRDALKWAFRMVKDPAVVVVAGVGAGAVASPMVAELIAEHYPNAHVVQIGNGSGGFRAAALPGILTNWGVPRAMRESGIYQDFDSTQISFETLYTGFRHPAPNLRMAQINSASDSTQLRFLSRMGVTGMPLEIFMKKNLAEIHAVRPEFRSYVVPGKKHTVLLSAAFYATYVDGVMLRDWVANLIEGKDVANVGSELLNVPEPLPAAVVAAEGDSLHVGADSLGMAADSLGVAAHPAGVAADSLQVGGAPAQAEAPADSAAAHGTVDHATATHTAAPDSVLGGGHVPADTLLTAPPKPAR